MRIPFVECDIVESGSDLPKFCRTHSPLLYTPLCSDVQTPILLQGFESSGVTFGVLTV